MMTDEQLVKVKKSLVLHEGWRNFPYTDTLGNLTIGVGFNLSDRGLSDDWIQNQFFSDVNFFHKNLYEFPWYHLMSENRQVVLIDMAFMGWKKFLGFEKMIQALENLDYEAAAEEILNSDWAKEVKGRAIQLSEGMRTGVYNV